MAFGKTVKESEEIAREALRLASHKLGVTTKIVTKEGLFNMDSNAYRSYKMSNDFKRNQNFTPNPTPMKNLFLSNLPLTEMISSPAASPAAIAPPPSTILSTTMGLSMEMNG